MRAVKDYRSSDAAQNFIDFLDKLTMISQDTVAFHIYPNIPFYRATLQRNSQVLEIAETYNQAVQYEVLSSDKGVGVTIIEDILVEQESNKSAVVEDSNDKSIGVDDRPLTEKDFMGDINEEYDSVDNKDYILCTNQWMQTDEDGLVIPTVELNNEIVQTIEVQPQEYKSTLNQHYKNNQMNRIKTTILISDKKTQAPSEDEHYFSETCSKDVQVTENFAEMTTYITVGNQVDYTTVEVISAECQVVSRTDMGTPDDAIYDVSSDKELSLKLSSVDDMEKYANSRLESCLGVNSSDMTIDEYPRNIYTETFVTRERYEQISGNLSRSNLISFTIFSFFRGFNVQ